VQYQGHWNNNDKIDLTISGKGVQILNATTREKVVEFEFGTLKHYELNGNVITFTVCSKDRGEEDDEIYQFATRHVRFLLPCKRLFDNVG
jgi:hypothetical protein